MILLLHFFAHETPPSTPPRAQTGPRSVTPPPPTRRFAQETPPSNPPGPVQTDPESFTSESPPSWFDQAGTPPRAQTGPRSFTPPSPPRRVPTRIFNRPIQAIPFGRYGQSREFLETYTGADDATKQNMLDNLLHGEGRNISEWLDLYERFTFWVNRDDMDADTNANALHITRSIALAIFANQRIQQDDLVRQLEITSIYPYLEPEQQATLFQHLVDRFDGTSEEGRRNLLPRLTHLRQRILPLLGGEARGPDRREDDPLRYEVARVVARIDQLARNQGALWLGDEVEGEEEWENQEAKILARRAILTSYYKMEQEKKPIIERLMPTIEEFPFYELVIEEVRGALQAEMACLSLQQNQQRSQGLLPFGGKQARQSEYEIQRLRVMLEGLDLIGGKEGVLGFLNIPAAQYPSYIERSAGGHEDLPTIWQLFVFLYRITHDENIRDENDRVKAYSWISKNKDLGQGKDWEQLVRENPASLATFWQDVQKSLDDTEGATYPKTWMSPRMWYLMRKAVDFRAPFDMTPIKEVLFTIMRGHNIEFGNLNELNSPSCPEGAYLELLREIARILELANLPIQKIEVVPCHVE